MFEATNLTHCLKYLLHFPMEVFVQLVDKENAPKAPTTGARRGKLLSKNFTKIKVRKVFTFLLYFFEISHLSSGNICFERFLKRKVKFPPLITTTVSYSFN